MPGLSALRAQPVIFRADNLLAHLLQCTVGSLRLMALLAAMTVGALTAVSGKDDVVQMADISDYSVQLESVHLNLTITVRGNLAIVKTPVLRPLVNILVSL